MKILALGAHPDDIEFGCSALLIKEAKKGSQIKKVVLSLGEAGSSGSPAQRKQESQKAAKLLGAEIEFVNMGGDCHIEYKPQNTVKIAGIIRKYKPDIVLCPTTYENQHPDHAIAGKLTKDACRLARYGGLKELKKLPVHKIKALYFYAITRDFGNRPDIVVDVTREVEAWKQLMNCHHSQMKTKKYEEMQLVRAHSLGIAVGVDYAIGLYANDPIRLDAISDIHLSSRNF